MKRLLLITLLLAAYYLLPASSILASHGEEIIPPLPASYLFHLYYDNGQLFADRDFEFKYDVLPEEFVPEKLNTQFPFKGEVINFLNQTVATFQFDPRGGDANFLKGKVSVSAPYVPDGQKVVFYDAQARPLLTIFVSESSFCNDDAVCNFDRGEDEKTCPNDCTGATPLPSPEPEGEQTDMLKVAIYVLIIAGVALGGWYGWKKWKSPPDGRAGRQGPPISQFFPVNLPPQQPLS